MLTIAASLEGLHTKPVSSILIRNDRPSGIKLITAGEDGYMRSLQITSSPSDEDRRNHSDCIYSRRLFATAMEWLSNGNFISGYNNGMLLEMTLESEGVRRHPTSERCP